MAASAECVLITGGAGFIGRWLVKECLSAGLRVIVIDDLRFGREENITEFHDNITFYRGDVLDSHLLASVLEKHRPDVIFHLAALHYIPYCNREPRKTLHVNVLGTACVLEAAVRHHIARMVVASTGAIYEDREEPLDEAARLAPLDVYGLSKMCAEQLVSFWSRDGSIESVIARLFNTYGPYETNPHLIPQIIDSLKRGDSCVTLGNLHTRRDYIYVEDCAQALLALGVTLKEAGNSQPTIVNVGTGMEYSALEIIDHISGLLGRRIEVCQAPSRIRRIDKLHQRANVTRIQALVGWRPRTSLEEGLKKLLEHEGLL